MSEIAFSLLGLYSVSLQLVEPHFELPQALSLLSLVGPGWRREKEEEEEQWGEQRVERRTWTLESTKGKGESEQKEDEGERRREARR